MPLVIAPGGVLLRHEVTEALRAATLGGAYALRAPDRGALVRGRLADIVLWDADHEGAFAWTFGLQAAPRLARRRTRHPVTRRSPMGTGGAPLDCG